MSSRTRLRNAFETTLNGAINNSVTTITLTSASGLTAPGYIVIDPDSPSLREYISFTGISVNDLTGVTRGLAGSASGAQAHDDAIPVRMVMVHQVVDDLFDDIEALEALDHGTIGGTADDDHSQYHTDARATTWHDADDHSGLAAGDLPAHTHESAGEAGKLDHGLALNGLGDDDHTIYHTDARALIWHDADDHSGLAASDLPAHDHSGASEGGSIDHEHTLEFSELGVLATKTGTVRWYPPVNITIVDVAAMVGVAPTGATILVDVNNSGTTIFTTQSLRPTIAISGFHDESGTPNGDVTLVANTDYITVDIDQVGSTIAGEDLVVQIRYTRD